MEETVNIEILRVYAWILGGACFLLLTMLGFFLTGLFRQFQKLVQAVQHIDKVVAVHGSQIRQLFGLPPVDPSTDSDG